MAAGRGFVDCTVCGGAVQIHVDVQFVECVHCRTIVPMPHGLDASGLPADPMPYRTADAMSHSAEASTTHSPFFTRETAHQAALAAIDDEWLVQRHNYFVLRPGGKGQPACYAPPSKITAFSKVLIGLVVVTAVFAYIRTHHGLQVSYLALLTIGVVLYLVATAVAEYRSAITYDAAYNDYRTQRTRVDREWGGSGSLELPQ